MGVFTLAHAVRSAVAEGAELLLPENLADKAGYYRQWVRLDACGNATLEFGCEKGRFRVSFSADVSADGKSAESSLTEAAVDDQPLDGTEAEWQAADRALKERFASVALSQEEGAHGHPIVVTLRKVAVLNADLARKALLHAAPPPPPAPARARPAMSLEFCKPYAHGERDGVARIQARLFFSTPDGYMRAIVRIPFPDGLMDAENIVGEAGRAENCMSHAVFEELKRWMLSDDPKAEAARDFVEDRCAEYSERVSDLATDPEAGPKIAALAAALAALSKGPVKLASAPKATATEAVVHLACGKPTVIIEAAFSRRLNILEPLKLVGPDGKTVFARKEDDASLIESIGETANAAIWDNAKRHATAWLRTRAGEAAMRPVANIALQRAADRRAREAGLLLSA